MDDELRRAGNLVPARTFQESRENAAPPIWFGLVFLAFGLLAVWGCLAVAGGVPDLGPGILVIAIGVLFALVGAALVLTSLTAARGRRPRHAAGATGPVDVFTRSPIRILVDLVLGPVGGLGFLAFAPVWVELAGPLGLIFGAMFVFFGVVVLSASVTTIRRGVRRAVAEIGPAGIWTSELPRRLAWSEIDRLEVEVARGATSEGTALYKRLAIWPRDPALAARAPGRRLVGVIRWFTSLTNVRAGEVGLSDPAKMAPYGIQAYDIEQDFSEVLRSAGRYARVIGAPPDPDAPFEPPVLEPTPPPGGMVGAVLANLADAAAGRPPLPPRPTSSGSRPVDAPPPDDPSPIGAAPSPGPR